MEKNEINTSEKAELVKKEAEKYYLSGNIEKANELFAKILKFATEYFPSDHLIIAESKVNYAKTLHEHDNLDKAIDLFNEAIKIYLKQPSTDNLALGKAYMDLAHVLATKEDYEISLKFFNKSRKIFSTLLSSNDVLNLYAELGVAFCHANLCNYDKAKNTFEKLLDLFSKNYPEYYEDISSIYMGLFNVHRKLKEFELAYEMLKKLILIESKLQHQDHYFIFGFFYELGCSLNKAKKIDFSKDVLLGGLDYIKRNISPEDKVLTNEMVLEAMLELSLAHVELKEYDSAQNVIYDLFIPISKTFGPNHSTTKCAEKVLRKSYGFPKYITTKKRLRKKLLRLLKESGSTKESHIHWLAQRSKLHNILVATFWAVVMVISTIYFYTKGYISNTTNLKTILYYFVLVFLFASNISVLYRIYRRISNFTKVYGFRNFTLFMTMNSLRKRQNEEILSIDNESKFHEGKGPNKLIKIIFMCFYVIFIAGHYPDNMKFDEKNIYEIENVTNIRFSLYKKFWINISFYTILGTLLLFLWILYGYLICLGLAVCIIFQVIYCTVFFFKPPTFLFLGTSSPDTFNLLSLIDTSTYRFGTASLLHAENYNVYRSYEIDLWNIYRTRDDVKWMDSVKNLIDFIPAIIIDGRSTTKAVREEIDYIFKSNKLEKLIIIIVSENRKDPFLKNKWYTDRCRNVQLLFESQLSYVLKYLIEELIKNPSYKSIVKFKEKIPDILDKFEYEIKI